MTRVSILILLLFISGHIFSQNAQDPEVIKQERSLVSKWINNHPEVKIIPLDYFLSIPAERREKYMEADFCMLHEGEEPTWAEIEAYENSGMQNSILNMQVLNNEMIQVDDWIAHHPNVTLIEMNDFQNMNSVDRAHYLSMSTVIIYTGHLRQEDIDAFESNQ